MEGKADLLPLGVVSASSIISTHGSGRTRRRGGAVTCIGSEENIGAELPPHSRNPMRVTMG